MMIAGMVYGTIKTNWLTKKNSCWLLLLITRIWEEFANNLFIFFVVDFVYFV